MEVVVTPENQEQQKVEVAKLRDGIAQAKADLAAENARMAAERAILNAQAQGIQADSYRLMVDQNASNEVLRRKYQSHLPLIYESRNLFNTPGAGASDPPEVNQAVAAPGAGAPAQPHATGPPRPNNFPQQYVPAPPGHYSNPLDNMIAAASRLAAIPMEGYSLAAIETRRARDLLQTAVVQQQAYSYSRDRIHSTPRPSKSYSRHMESEALSSNAQRRDQHGGYNPVQDRVSQEDKRAAQLAA